MNILADENIAFSVITRLRADGHFVELMAEIAKGDPDTSVLDIANQRNAVVLTEDKDFGELIMRHQMQAVGVVLIRLNGFSPIERAEIISRVIRVHESKLSGAFTVIRPRTVRIRPNPYKNESS
jgi:predicted nuclease of predicted toxin-antitoxin system